MPLEAAQQLVDRLIQLQRRVVFAESCTSGLIAAELGRVAGVSQFLCGSAVTYRSDTKVQWLGVDRADIQQYTAVSEQVADQMAQGVLRNTPEASLSASITGHLGPQAPEGFDGLVFIGIAVRHENKIATSRVERRRLDISDRDTRQKEAAIMVLQLVLEQLSQEDG